MTRLFPARASAANRPLVADRPSPDQGGPAPHVVVCIPTYNEAENIAAMLRATRHALGGAGEILVLDDGSPDHTADLAQAVADELAGISVIRRPAKAGLGPAYLAGFEAALARGAELVIQMDCDFSHDPADIPRLIAASRDADLVLGSRYVAGGRVVNWPRRRVAISRGGSTYARLVLGTSLRDVTAGFKCWHRAVLEGIPFEQVRTTGYAFNIELTYRALVAGHRVVEIPITFTERTIGESKMSAAIALEAIHQVPRLRRRFGRAPR